MELQDFLQDIARGAGQIIKDKYHVTKIWRTKSSPGDIVTEVDEASEKYVMDRIHQEFPNDHILSEESGASGIGEPDRVWIIDPLDGTRNYMMGIPFFCVSIGIARNGVPEAGVIYDPIHDEMFYTERGKGAWLNGERISVCNEVTLDDSLISVSWVKRKVDRKRFIEYLDNLSKDTSYFRRFGSAALATAYVACGRLHAYLQGGLNPWDVAAGVLLIEEAGGVVTDFKGNPLDLRNPDIEILTSNPDLHEMLLNQVMGIRK
ncbi:MAG: inositol monophosphatase family protein [Armatimonadota bacterium]|nr:inositol monophosphatase [bacterium]